MQLININFILILLYIDMKNIEGQCAIDFWPNYTWVSRQNDQ